MNLDLGDCKTNQYINEDSEVSGELLLLGTNSGIVKSNATEQKSFALDLYDRNKKDKNLSLIHISEPTRRTPISYAVFCLKKKYISIICMIQDYS